MLWWWLGWWYIFTMARNKLTARFATGGTVFGGVLNRNRKKRDLPQGVYRRPSGKFGSSIRWGGKTRHIDTFDTPEQASAAYMSVKKHRSKNSVKDKAAFDEVKAKALEMVHATDA